MCKGSNKEEEIYPEKDRTKAVSKNQDVITFRLMKTIRHHRICPMDLPRTGSVPTYLCAWSSRSFSWACLQLLPMDTRRVTQINSSRPLTVRETSVASTIPTSICTGPRFLQELKPVLAIHQRFLLSQLHQTCWEKHCVWSNALRIYLNRLYVRLILTIVLAQEHKRPPSLVKNF